MSFRGACVLGLVGLLAFVGCAAPTFEDEEDRGSSESAQRIVRVGDVMARAQEWVDKKVPYCGGVRGGTDHICGGTCRRPAAAWDKYRTDCSGFVSWCWQIPENPTTYVYMNDRAGDMGWTTVAIDDAMPGDALVAQEHIKLLKKRTGDSMEIYEESTCGTPARLRTQNIRRQSRTHFTFADDGRQYHVIRLRSITAGGGGSDAVSEDTVAEGSQAFLTAGEQHYFARAANGDLAHTFWVPTERKVLEDVWGQNLAGQPAALVSGDEQHAFARSTAGALEHYWWTRGTKKANRDTWAAAGSITGDPAVILMGGGQHAFATDAAGNLQHWYWTKGKPVTHDTWASSAATAVEGRPTVLAAGVEQHVFARGTGDGALHHFWWTPADGVKHDVWAASISSEPAARNINGDQHVFAVDNAGTLQHWWWSPTTKKVTQDTWSDAAALHPLARPSLLTKGLDQHVFARGRDGQLEHYFWTPGQGLRHDTWAAAGSLTGDPATLLVGPDEHVFAQTAAGAVDHWWWSQKTNVSRDQW